MEPKTIDIFHTQKGRGILPWGDNLLLLTTRGAKSGDSITTPLVYRRENGHLM